MKDLTDEQWLKAIENCPSNSKILGIFEDGTVVIRHEDGSGLAIALDGSIRKFDPQGKPCPGV
jgi:hypothetical protein